MIPTLLQILFEAISHCFIKCFNHSCSRDFPALSRFIHVLFMFYSVVLAFQFCHVFIPCCISEIGIKGGKSPKSEVAPMEGRIFVTRLLNTMTVAAWLWPCRHFGTFKGSSLLPEMVIFHAFLVKIMVQKAFV